MDIKRSTLIASLFCALAVALNACSDPIRPVQTDPPAAVVPVQGVKVTPQTAVFAVGETRQLVAAIGPVDATDQAVTWESSDTTVATVSPSGLVTGKSPGAAVFITAHTHDGAHQSSANVTITDPPVTVVPVNAVKVTPQSVVLALGETRQLVVAIGPVNATDQAVSWESSDSTVAMVSPSGLVTGKSSGAGVFITVYTHDGGHQSSANVTVGP